MKRKLLVTITIGVTVLLLSGVWVTSVRSFLPEGFSNLFNTKSSSDAVWGQGLESYFGQSVALASSHACIDSDGGLIADVAGFVEGIGQNGWPYTRYDTCETGSFEGYLKEFYCDGDQFRASRIQCEAGCFDGACLSDVPTCTDADLDTYAIEGGVCGPVDCSDSDPLVNPGAAEACGNGVDDNCDGLTDSEDPVCLVCSDADGDGFAFEGGACGVSDCDDTNPLVNPNAAEVCDNGIDDNCNGKIDAEDAACGAPPNVIVIGWDGAQRDHLMECYNQELPDCSGGLPNLAALGGGVIYDTTITSGDTATKPGWAQIFSGYNADVLGIYSNGVYQPIPEGYTVFEKLEDHFGQDNIVTMFISGKAVNTGGACVGEPTTSGGQPVIEAQGQPWCLTKDHLDYYENDLRQNAVVGNRALELLEAHQNDLFMAAFIFRVPDVVGHVGGENSPQYTQALVDDDLWLGAIVDKLVELGIDDQTLIYVTTDHGFDEGITRHGNAPYTFMVSNDDQVVREGDRKDIAPTILERYGIGLGPIGIAPAVDGYSLYSALPFTCVAEGHAYLDFPGAPACCSGLSLISLDKAFNSNLLVFATGGAGDNSGYCTACGDGVCTEPENLLNCSLDCN